MRKSDDVIDRVMAEPMRSDTDHQQDIKYDEPEAPAEFGGQFSTKPSLDVKVSPKSEMDFNISSNTTMDLSTEELSGKGDNQVEEMGQGDGSSVDKVVNLDKSDLELPEKMTFFKSVPLDEGSCDSAKMTDSVISMSTTSSKQDSTTSSGKKSPSTVKSDAAKRDKERDREERIRLQREKLAEERQKKIEEMREQQRLAQEKREHQLELRRLKIDELRRRDEERRMAVEDRRRKQEESEKARKESIILKSQERITRYEQWKASGRKGGRMLVYGFGSRTPREVCQPVERRRSSSHSALMRRSPNGSDSDSYRPQRRAVSACSTVRRHCCIDINRLTGYPGSSPPSKLLSMSTGALYHSSKRDFSSSGNLNARERPESLLVLNPIPENGPQKKRRSFLAPSGAPPTRPRSTMNLSARENIKMREQRSTPRKPRPASIAGSVPSFISVETPKGTSRSKSTDRIARDRQKTPGRSTPKHEKEEKNLQDKKDKKPGVDIRKLTEKRKAELKKLEDKKKEQEGEDSQGSDREKTPDRPAVRLSQKTIDRLSTPRIAKYKTETPTKVDNAKDKSTPTPTKGTKKSVTIVAPNSSTRKTKTPKQKNKENKKPSSKEGSTEALETSADTPKSVVEITIDKPTEEKVDADALQPEASKDTPRSLSPTSSKDDEKTDGEEEVSVSEQPKEDEKEAPAPKKTPEKVVKIVEPDEQPATPVQSRPGTHSTPATPGSATKSQKEIELDEYKAKLAEKRRQAREKAEKEAELERQRLEQIRLEEEERQRKEEEEQKRMEEEAARLAEEARKIEEERLRKAIEAEEQRRKEEAERQEQEKKAKEEAERKAKEEAERADKERQEKAKRDEEERLERKKRLEMIMKRVKSDSPMSGSMTASMISTGSPATGTLGNSMTSSMIVTGSSDKADSPFQSLSNSPSKNSLQSNDGGEDSTEETNGLDEKSEAQETPKFKSPLLQKLVESKSQNGGSETPKFKSPLLQNLLGKKRLAMDKPEDKNNGVSANGDKKDGDEPSEQTHEISKERMTEGESGQVDSPVITDSESDKSESQSSKSEGSVQSDNSSTTKDVSIGEQKLGTNSVILKSEVSSSSLNGLSQNGEVEQYAQELVDSSISMKTADSSLGTSSDQSVLGGSLVDSQTISSSVEQVSTTDTGSTGQNSEFEEFIDLSVTNKNFEVKAHQSLFAHQTTDDLLNLNANSIGNSLDNISSDAHPKPLIAFEDNAARRQEVTDFLS